MEEIGGALSLLAILAFVAFLIWHGDRNKQEQRRQKLAERERILDRIGTGDALTGFLQSDEGKRFLEQLNEPVTGRHRGGNLRMSVIGLLTAGVITLCIGAGFFSAAPQVGQDLLIPGGILVGVGVGCLVAALIHYVLGKAWGMLKPDEGDANSGRRLE
jgi:hypothetical protein